MTDGQRQARAASDGQVASTTETSAGAGAPGGLRKQNAADGGFVGSNGSATSGTYNSSKSNSHGNTAAGTNHRQQINSHRGKTLGEKWILGDEIGRGAYASVFKGLDLKKGGFVAIKQFSLSGVGEDELAGIMQEIDLLKELRHRNIVEYFGSLRSRSHLYIIMEYVENGSLANIVRPSKFGPFPESLVAVYVAQVLEGLAFLHDQGVIHRDIKGANILTTKEGIVKLADFGVAIRFGECAVDVNGATQTSVSSSNNGGTPVTQSVKSNAGAVVGTPYWMAPEVIEMSGVTEKSDIWSVGCTAIELLTSSPPYFDLQPMSAMFRIVQDEFVPLPTDVSEAMLDFLQQCFNKEPKLRPDAKTLLIHPWIVTSKKQLQKSWRLQREKLGSNHEDIASVVERMVEHDASGAERAKTPGGGSQIGTPKLFGEDSGPLFLGTETPGKADGNPPVCRDILQSGFGPADAGSEQTFMSRAGQGCVPSDDALSAVLADVSTSVVSDSSGGTRGPGDADEASSSGVYLEGSDGKSRLELAEIQSIISSLDSRRADCPGMLRRLEEILKLKPERKAQLVDMGMNQLIVCCEHADANVVAAALRLVEMLVQHSVDTLERLCLLGLVPIIIRSVGPDRSQAVRSVAASLLFQISLGSLFTAQTFVACQGIGALASFVPLPGEGRGRSRSDSPISVCERSGQVFMAIDSIWHLIELKIMGRRGEICSLFARSKLVERLATLLWSWSQISDESEGGRGAAKAESSEPKRGWWIKRGDSSKSRQSKAAHQTRIGEREDSANAASEDDKSCKLLWKYCEKVASLMLVLSMSGKDVKDHFYGDATTHRLIESVEFVKKKPVILSRLLRCIRSLTSEESALEPLQRAGAILALVPIMLVPENAGDGIAVVEANELSSPSSIRSEALRALYNLCHINRTRQEQAALAGVIPSLLHFARQGVDEATAPIESQQALLLLFALVHTSRRTRTELWRNDVLTLYLGFLCDKRWQVPAFDSIVTWLVHEASIVEGRLLQRGAQKQIIGLLTSADGEDLLRILEQYLNMMTKSKKLCMSLASYGLSQVLINMLEGSEDPHVTLTLLKVLRVLYEHHPRPREVSGNTRLKSQLKRLVEAEEEVVLMKQISQALLTAFNIGTSLV